MRIYLASSGRNPAFSYVRDNLRRAGHTVYDWTKGAAAYSWNQVGVPHTDACTIEEMIGASGTKRLQEGLRADLKAIDVSDAFVLLLPCGADAHYEFGYASRSGKFCAILVLDEEPFRASQFYGICGATGDIYGAVSDLLAALGAI